MIKKVFGLMFIGFVMVSCQNTDRKVRLAGAFIEELKRGTENAILVKEYLNISDPSTVPIAFLSARLNRLREEVRALDTIRISSHSEAMEALVIPEEERKNVIFVSGKDRVYPLIIRGDKIAALSTLNRGGKRIFMLL